MGLDDKGKEVLRRARSVIRDLAQGWPVRELAAPPEEVCHQLSDLLEEDYDFEFGEESPKEFCGICNKPGRGNCVCAARGLR